MVLIIGGGISGMTLAEKFRRDGHEVTLIERGEELGGQCASVTVDEIDYDRFYHVFYTKDSHQMKLIQRLGLADEVVKVQPTHGFIYQNKIVSLNSPLDMLRFPSLSLKGRAQLIWTILKGRLTRDWRKLENTTSEKWLIQNGGAEVYERFWRPMMKAKFNEGLPALSAVDIWTRIDRLTTYDPGNKMCYLKGKLRKLVNTYEKYLINLGVKIHKNCSAQKVNVSEGRITSVETEIGLIKPEMVIFAIPAPALVPFIPDQYSEYKNRLRKIKYIGNICLSLIMDRKLTPYYMNAIGDDTTPFTGIMGLSNLYGTKAFGGRQVYYLSHYFLDNLDYLKKSDDEVFASFFSHLQRLLPIQREEIKAHFVSRIRYTEPLYDVGYRSPDFDMPFANAYLVTGAQIYPRTPVINSSIELAERAYGHISRSFKSRPQTEQECFGQKPELSTPM